MKKFLYISYYYPPIQSIASMRSWKLAKYIRDFGWEPIVLASASDSQSWGSPLPDVRVGRLENSLFLERTSKKTKKQLTHSDTPFPNPGWSASLKNTGYMTARWIKRALREAFAYPDDYADWGKKALLHGREILAEEKVDLILSTAEPFSSHIIASTLSKETGIPWIADYRDLWTQNHVARHTKLRLFFERRLESSIVKNASAVITTSEPLALMLGSFLQKEVHTITNGFDPEDYVLPVKTDSIFSLIYTGVIYEKKQNATAVLDAINILLKKKEIEAGKFKLRFFGSNAQHLAQLLKEKGIDDLVHIHNTISFQECVQKQKAAAALLFLNWNDLKEKGLFSGKIFEYLAARRPILAFPRNPGSVVDQLLEQTRAGVLCDTPEAIAAVLKEWYDAFYFDGNLTYQGIEEEIDKYSRKNQAQEFAILFDAVTRK